MPIEYQDLGRFFSDLLNVDDVEISFLQTNKSSTLILNISDHSYDSHPDIMNLDHFFKICGSEDVVIPEWENINPGCDTCGDGMISQVNGFIINNVLPYEEIVKNAAVIRWEIEVAREAAARAAEDAARILRHENRKTHEKKSRIIRESQKLLDNALALGGVEKLFEEIWMVYRPLVGMKKQEYKEKVSTLPSPLKFIFNSIFRKTRWENQNRSGLYERFIHFCHTEPERMSANLFPNGEKLKTNYRTVRTGTDEKSRNQLREFERDGFIVF